MRLENKIAALFSFTDGTIPLGAKPTSGQVLKYDGTSVIGADVLASDAGITSLEAADASAGLPYVTAANTWTSLALAANKGIYATSSSALSTYDLTAFGRTLGGSADAAAAAAALSPLTQSSSATPTLEVTNVRMGLSHASPTITVPALSGAPTDWAVTFQNETASVQTLTLNRSGSDTFNGGSTSVVLSVPAGARASLWKLSSTTAWVGL